MSEDEDFPISRYKQGKKLGQGGFGVVCRYAYLWRNQATATTKAATRVKVKAAVATAATRVTSAVTTNKSTRIANPNIIVLGKRDIATTYVL